MIKFTFVLFSLSIIVSIGCSVQRRTVVNEPPIMQRGLTTFSNDFGTLVPDSMSLFLWPEQDEKTFTETIATVSRASMEMDRMMVVLAGISKEKAKLESDFSAAACVKAWAVLTPEEDPDFIDWVQSWKSDAPASCVENQSLRKDLQKQIDQIGSVQQPVSILKIMKAIDPGFPDKIENTKSVSAPDSKFVLKPGGTAEILLKDFLFKGRHFSTDETGDNQVFDAHYDSKFKLLSFKVHELDAAGKATARDWEFVLERAPDFLGSVRFIGDIKVTSLGKTLRTGTAKIEGHLK